MTNRYDALRAQYGETHAVAAMILAADGIGMTDWAQGFAQGVRILEGAWPTDRFVPEERRIVSLLARLAEWELSDLDGLCVCADLHRAAVAGAIWRRGVTSPDGAFVRGDVGSISAGAGQAWQALGRALPALSQ